MSGRFFLPLRLQTGDELTLTGADAHHAARVLRLKPDDRIVAVGPDGSEFTAVVEQVDASTPQLTARVTAVHQPQREPRLRVTVAQALLKGDRMDWALQKATEIGAHAFIPYTSARTTVRLDDRRQTERVGRWQRIVTGAAQQSGRLTVPSVAPVQPFAELAGTVRAWVAVNGGGSVLLASESETKHGLFTALSARFGLPATEPAPEVAQLLLIVGPEGGFELQESADLIAAGATAVTIGPLILRAETAAPVILSNILYHAGDLGRAYKNRY